MSALLVFFFTLFWSIRGLDNGANLRGVIDFEGKWHTEVELLDIVHEEGCELGHILRANSDDRDRYTALWPYKWKRIYLQHMRALHGWAMYLIRPWS